MKTLVLGIGNTLLTDEGFGIHAMNYLRTHCSNLPDIDYLDGGTLNFTLLPYIEETEGLIILDAAELRAPVGTIQCFVNEEMDIFLNTRASSIHEVGIRDVLAMAKLRERLPLQRILIAVQPQKIEWGNELTTEMAQAIPQIVPLVVQFVKQWMSIT